MSVHRMWDVPSERPLVACQDPVFQIGWQAVHVAVGPLLWFAGSRPKGSA